MKKDFRVKEVIRNNGTSHFQIQRYAIFCGWFDAGHRMDEYKYVHDTLKQAQDHIKEIRNSGIKECKYHY